MTDRAGDAPGEVAPVRWKVHLRSPPAVVHRYLATAGGRARFWAESAEETGNTIEFVFKNGQRLVSTVLEHRPPHLLRLSYFGGSRVTFELERGEDGGTDLRLTEDGLTPELRAANLPGWVAVLLSLKATVDFGIDLRNGDRGRTWDTGYVDG